jgi:hypothetical protein
MKSVIGKAWFMSLMLKMKKKMDANKKPAADGEEKKQGGFSVNLKNMDGFMQMLGGFTVLRMTSMLGMVNVSFTKEELLALNAQLNKIKKPKNK